MKKTSITLALAAVIAATAITFTSCGGDDNNNMTNGSSDVTVRQTDGGASDSGNGIIGDMSEDVSDILDGGTVTR